MATIRTAAPQFLVDRLSASLVFYTEQLGFATDFVYEDFYASVTRDGATIHLKCAPKLAAERELRHREEHLDAYLDVQDVGALHEELVARGTTIAKPLETQPWGATDFYVRDLDGYVLCFSETA